MKHEPSQGGDAVATLARYSSVGVEEVKAFVVADGRGGDARSFGDLADRQQSFRHSPT